MNQAAANHESVRKSLEEYGRGLAGGLVFSLPLLYTMEVWWTGFTASPERILVALLFGYFLLTLYNHYAGLHPGADLREVLIDSVEELGIGLLIAFLVLWLAGQLSLGGELSESLGKVAVEGIFVAIGVSVGTAQLGGNEKEDMEGDPKSERGILGELALALCGSVLIGANVAPTEEIVMIAAEATPWQILGLLGFAVAVAVVLYYSEFSGSRPILRGGVLPPVLLGTVATVAVALLSSAAMLWFFGRFESTHYHVVAAEAAVLGLPATLGASAGRLLLGS